MRYVRRKALLVGIDDYENPNNNLQGCRADQQDMGDTLKLHGFPASRVKNLSNEQATKKGIIEGLGWLTDGAEPKDVLVFFYSGHGSQVADLDNEEEDGYDEIICPYDISWNKKTYITDDDLYNYFTSKTPAGVITDAIFDSCNSGTITKSLNKDDGLFYPLLSSKTVYKKQRYLPPPDNHRFRIDSMIPQFTKVNRLGKSIIKEGSSTKSERVQNNSVISACESNQVSYELLFGDRVRGAFTYYFCNLLREVAGNMTRGDVIRTVKSRMSNEGFEQRPTLEVPNAEALNLFPFRKFSEVDRPEEVKTPRR
jgi:hypothetical protein